MNKEGLIFCVQAAQNGDPVAMEQLLMYLYGMVDYQCRKLLPTPQAADKMTPIVLKTVAAKLDTLQNPEELFTWLGRLTSVRCLRVRATLLEDGQAAADAEPVNVSFPSMELNKAETARVAEMLTDLLNPEEKLSLYLFSLGALTPKAISGLTGVPEETVQAQIQSAQTAVLKQMKRYADQGVTFTQTKSLPALLRTRMMMNPAPERAQAVVRSILPQRTDRRPSSPRAPQQPVPQQPQGKSQAGLIRTLSIIAGLLAVVLVISLTVLFLKLKKANDTLMLPGYRVSQTEVREVPECYIL